MLLDLWQYSHSADEKKREVVDRRSVISLSRTFLAVANINGVVSVSSCIVAYVVGLPILVLHYCPPPTIPIPLHVIFSSCALVAKAALNNSFGAHYTIVKNSKETRMIA